MLKFSRVDGASSLLPFYSPHSTTTFGLYVLSFTDQIQLENFRPTRNIMGIYENSSRCFSNNCNIDRCDDEHLPIVQQYGNIVRILFIRYETITAVLLSDENSLLCVARRKKNI